MEWAAAWPLSFSTNWRYGEPPRDSVEPPQNHAEPQQNSVEPLQKRPRPWDISVKPPHFSATYLLRQYPPLSARTGRAPSYPVRCSQRRVYGQMNRLTAVRAGTKATGKATGRRDSGNGRACSGMGLPLYRQTAADYQVKVWRQKFCTLNSQLYTKKCVIRFFFVSLLPEFATTQRV